jgi:tetraacyldisaccharide 4'-kinase
MLARAIPDVAVLTRGYGRAASERIMILAAGASAPASITGDEAQLILRDKHAQVGIGADRYEAGCRLRAAVFLLDDGFQHARVHRDLDIVVLDGLDPLAGGYTFPAGRLREPLGALERADAVVISRSERRRFDGLLKLLPPGVPVFYGATNVIGFEENASGEVLPPNSFEGKEVYAFCGLGNPEAFRRTLVDLGCIIVGFRAFADHHPYTMQDLGQIERAAKASAIVTTEKDAVRLPRAIGFSLLIEVQVPGLEEYVLSGIPKGVSGTVGTRDIRCNAE